MPTESEILDLPWHGDALVALDVHRMLMLVGPPGVGKTEFAIAAARRRTGEVPEVVQGSPELERADFWGQTELRGDSTTFVDGPLARAIRHGRWLIVEELNLIPHEVRATFLGLRGRDDVRHPGTAELMPIPTTFRLLATANPESLKCRSNGMLAQAVLDDFIVLAVPDVDDETVHRLARRDFPDVEAGAMQAALELWRRFREVGQSEESSSEDGRPVVGYRSLKHYLRLTGAGMATERAAELAFVNRYITDDSLYEAARLRDMLQ